MSKIISSQNNKLVTNNKNIKKVRKSVVYNRDVATATSSANRVSRIEGLARKYLKVVLPDEMVIYNVRPDWLKNESTGRNLELDIFFPRLGVGIEVNGIHHGLREQKKKDVLKRELCKKVGVKVITVTSGDDILKLGKKLKSDVKISPSLVRELKRYGKSKSRKRSVLKKYRAVRAKLYYEAIEDRQNEEKESNRRKMMAKGLIK